MLPLVAFALGAILWAQPVSGQSLDVKVVDQFSDPVVNATVAIGDMEVPTDDSGSATFQGLGSGPHSVVVSAPEFATAVEDVVESEGTVTITLKLQAVSEVIDVTANLGTRTQGVQPLESVGRGSSGTDMNAIPIAAIERIEVLRDGAAAQYGSDAIAGVINLVLKNSP